MRCCGEVHALWDGPQNATYAPRLKLNPNVLRVPMVPGCAPEKAYGDLYARGVRGVVLEAFGVGNMPMSEDDVSGWIPWLRSQRDQRRRMMIYLTEPVRVGGHAPRGFPLPVRSPWRWARRPGR